MTFNPQSYLPSGGATAPLDAMAKHLLETNGGNALANRVAPSPFASKVAKSQTQGTVFVSSTNSLANRKDAVTSESFLAGLGFSVGAIMKFKQHKDDPTQVPIDKPIGLVFIAAALLFLPTIVDFTGSTIFGEPAGTVAKPTLDDATSQSLGLFISPAFVSTRAELSSQMVASGVRPQEAQKISQALLTMWTIAISSGVRAIPSNTRNEIAAYFTDSCAACTPQMIDAAMTKSEQLVISNPALRLDQAQLKEVVVKINAAINNTDQDVLGGEGGKQIFIKTLQGKNITL
jgi:intracellular multiplication protein IcmD